MLRILVFLFCSLIRTSVLVKQRSGVHMHKYIILIRANLKTKLFCTI